MTTYQLPIKGKYRVTLPFGKKTSHKCGFHIGVDIVADSSKNIYPIAEGVVESINAHGTAYGNHVCIKHSDGLVSLYAHLSKVSVSKGQFVGLETILGREGSTGNSSGSHLHLELHKGKYKYPPKNSSVKACQWLVDPLKHIEVNSMVQKKNDIEGHWAEEPIKKVIDKGVMSVDNEGKFNPNQAMTRAEIATVICRLMGW